MKKLSVITTIGLIGILCLAFILIAIGFRVNLTDSIPAGLYRINNTGNIKNSYVIFCPDDRKAFKQAMKRGYIDHGLHCSGYGYLMKKVVATSGDVISVTSKGVFVNHTLIPYSKPKLKDGMSRLLPQWHALNYRLKEGEFVTMTSQSEWSFDSRYYGPIHIGQIKGIITPIWVINKLENKHG
ncbi:conjugative transfer signal peptidase TraF [Legionella pneumophila serogroup 1]